MAEENPKSHFRKAVAADAAVIRSLTREAYSKWVPLLGREPMPMSANYEEALKTNRIDLLFVGDHLAALIETVAHVDHLLIVNVAVAPLRQGGGLGRKLLAHAERLAARLELPETRLYTNKAFAGNVTFYTGLGYRVDREEEFMGGTSVHMSKPM